MMLELRSENFAPSLTHEAYCVRFVTPGSLHTDIS